MTKIYISSTYSDLVEHRRQETAVAQIAIENIRLAKQRELLERRRADLAADLQVVELRLDEFRAVLLAQSSVLTVTEFDAAVERFKARLLKGTDADLVRIKVV